MGSTHYAAFYGGNGENKIDYITQFHKTVSVGAVFLLIAAASENIAGFIPLLVATYY